MQNSLERIFEGLGVALREHVLPGVSDPWARIQVEAAAGILANLAVRVEWRCADLADEIVAVRGVLEEATAAAGAAPEVERARAVVAEDLPDRADNATLVASRAAHLEALAGVQAWAERCDDPAAGPVRDALRRVMAERLEADLALLAAARRGASGR